MKQILLILIACTLTVGCVSNKKILTAVRQSQAEVIKIGIQLSKLDSVYNSQQLIRYRYELLDIDKRYKDISDPALLERLKLLGRPKD